MRKIRIPLILGALLCCLFALAACGGTRLSTPIGLNVNPDTLVISWYEQKAVAVLLTLLYLGIKNIYLGPTLPAFLSKNVLDSLVEKYSIHPISTPEEDLKAILG